MTNEELKDYLIDKIQQEAEPEMRDMGVTPDRPNWVVTFPEVVRVDTGLYDGVALREQIYELFHHYGGQIETRLHAVDEDDDAEVSIQIHDGMQVVDGYLIVDFELGYAK